MAGAGRQQHERSAAAFRLDAGRESSAISCRRRCRRNYPSCGQADGRFTATSFEALMPRLGHNRAVVVTVPFQEAGPAPMSGDTVN
jgi:hypothetical protein